tara:strand:- start:596 stop:784 length:189 start_codon:yes stop_codon:yes gene_type:complete
MTKFTQVEIDTMIEAMMVFMRYDGHMPLRREKKEDVLKILANKPDYAWFYLTDEERKEFGEQ